MRHSLILFFLIFNAMSFGFAQGTAPNWTHADCNSVSHTLYSYLDSQEVVVMEFVMGCGSCTSAGNYLMTLKDQYSISNPGKVNFFLMDYYPSHTCVDVDSTWSSYNFDAYFSGCWTEKDYYFPTLYPMPAVVIAAGNYHTVIYQDISWQDSDTMLIKQAIDQFFNTVGLEETQNGNILFYPNPVDQVLYIDLKKYNASISNISIFDITSKRISTDQLSPYISGDILNLSTTALKSGSYIIEIVTATATLREVFVKN